MEVYFSWTDHKEEKRKLLTKVVLWAELVIALVFSAVLMNSCVMTPARADVLSVAQSQIGLGEVGANNRGQYVRQYLNGQEGLPWCAGFVSWCVRKADVKVPYYTLRAKDFLKLGKVVRDPRPGDIIVFTRKGGGHVGIVEKVSQDTITTIEGNVGEFPSFVQRRVYQRVNMPNFLGYVRLAGAK